MKVIDTRGTNIRVTRTPGTDDWYYSEDGVAYIKATFNECLRVVTAARNAAKQQGEMK